MVLIANQKGERKTSRKEREYLWLLQKITGHGIRSILTPGGQARVAGYFPDGFDPQTKTVVEFLVILFSFGIYGQTMQISLCKHFPQGCLVHCHGVQGEKCAIAKGAKMEDKNPFGTDARVVGCRWAKKKEDYATAGFRLSYIWECKYDKIRPLYEDLLKEYYADGDRPEPLAPRNALRGGRTEAFSLFYQHEESSPRSLYYIDKNRWTSF